MKRTTILMAAFLCLFSLTESPAQNTHKNMEQLNLTQEWDKTYPKSDKVNHSKVTFINRYGITLAADLYAPKTIFGGKLPAIAVSGPFGAVKEQSSGLYAQTLAERGFLTIAFDPSFTGESGGQPRSVASPDINTEDFSAAVDYLATRPDVDAERIGIIGICGWGGFAINAAANDTRIKATVASTMYDISRCTANGYFDAADNADARYKMRQEFNAQRTEDYRTDTYPRTVTNPEPTGDAPQFMKDYYDYYKTERGYHPRSINSGLGWNKTSNLAFLNAPILAYADEIRSAAQKCGAKDILMEHFDENALQFCLLPLCEDEKLRLHIQLENGRQLNAFILLLDLFVGVRALAFADASIEPALIEAAASRRRLLVRIGEHIPLALSRLGTRFIPYASEAILPEQMLGRWIVAREAIWPVLCDAYLPLARCGYPLTSEAIAADVQKLFGGHFLMDDDTAQNARE